MNTDLLLCHVTLLFACRQDHVPMTVAKVQEDIVKMVDYLSVLVDCIKESKALISKTDE